MKKILKKVIKINQQNHYLKGKYWKDFDVEQLAFFEKYSFLFYLFLNILH
jgi:hypothetical protein